MEKRKISLQSEKDVYFIVGLCHGINNIIVETIDMEAQSVVCVFLDEDAKKNYFEKTKKLNTGCGAQIQDGIIHEEFWGKLHKN